MSPQYYIYKPLPSDQKYKYIRLLYLEPAKNLEHSLYGCLVEHRLQNTRVDVFEALSYTWEDSDTHQIISLDRKELHIRMNLFYALRRLRYDNNTRVIWIDAICINQKDKEEKSQQVPLMGQIYTMAKSTTVWLGESICPVKDLIAYKLFLWASPHKTIHPWRRGRGGWNPPTLPDVLQTFNSLDLIEIDSNPYYVTKENIEHLLTRSWFSRRWIVQELCNAKHVVLYFGCHTLDWIDFAGGLSTFGFATSDEDKIIEKSSAGLLDVWRRGTKIESVLDHMQMFQQFGGSDDRDRIAAFLTIGWPQTSLGSDFTINYAKSVEENYYRFAAYMVTLGKGVDLLVSAGQCRRAFDATQAHTPSWVPDWRMSQLVNFKIRPFGEYDIRLTQDNCMETFVDVTHKITTEFFARTNSHPLNIPISTAPLLIMKGDILVSLIGRDGQVDENVIILRPCGSLNLYQVIGAYDALIEEWISKTLVPQQPSAQWILIR